MSETGVVNLGEGRLPPGPDRALAATFLLHIVRDFMTPARRADAMAELEGELAETVCRCLGIPPRTLRERLLLIAHDPELLVHFTRLLCRRTPTEIYQDVMAA
jgi:hypothetical protein